MDHTQGCGSEEHAACWALPSEFARLRYFFGQRLGVLELAEEQGYHLGKQRFHNRYGHGLGVLCGLSAERFVFPQGMPPDTPTSILRVRRGAALDACGREVVVGTDQCIDVNAWYQQHENDADVKAWFESPPLEPRLWVALRYRECPSDPAPAPRDACGCDAQGCDYGRVREGFELALLTAAQHSDCQHGTFPSAADLGTALASPDPVAALAALVGAGCPEVSNGGWLCLTSLLLRFDGTPPRVVDLVSLDNTGAERATLLSSSALQALVLELATAAAAAGSIGVGPTLGALSFEGASADAGTLALAVNLFDDGSGPSPLVVETFETSYLQVHRFETNTWGELNAFKTYQASTTPPRFEVRFDSGLMQGRYRLTLTPPEEKPIVDARVRPLRPGRITRDFELAMDPATSTLSLVLL